MDGVPLVADGNLLTARGEDADGNRSIPSNEIVLIGNTPPAAVADLTAAVDGRSVSLAWTPVGDPDVFGYVVRRDGQPLTRTVPQESAGAFQASVAQDWARYAFDRNPTTAWPPSAATGEWTVHFASPILVERIALRFAGEGDAPQGPARYTVLARWQDRYVPIVRVRDGARLSVSHRLPAWFATDAIRVALESPGRIAEIGIDRLDVVPAGASAFEDDPAPEGWHEYEVAAIDRYGAVGSAGSVRVGVGDVEPPAPPTGLEATPIVRDVQLTWNASPEPDVIGYVVLRDGARIGRASVPAYLDPGLPNATYVYTVIAVDAAGLESGESAPATAVIDVQPVPPAAPVILEPTDAAHPLTLQSNRTDVAGSAEAGTRVTLEVDGETRGSAPAEPGFERVSSEVMPGNSLALSADGRFVAWAASDDIIGVRGLPGGERVFPSGGSLWWNTLLFSPDGSQLAFSRTSPVGARPSQIALLSLPDGAVRVLLEERDPAAKAWSPDGRRLALSLYDHQAGGTVLAVLDVGSGGMTELDRTSGVDTHLRWSPDGARIASIRSWYGAAAELRVVDVASGRSDLLDEHPSPAEPPAWSPDGRRLAWTSAETAPLVVRVLDLTTGAVSREIGEPGADVLDARFSPDGAWLSYVCVQAVAGGGPVASLRAREERTGLVVTVVAAQGAWTRAEGHDWVGGQLALRAAGLLERFAPVAGRFVVPDVALRPGENHLVARATDPVTELSSPDSEAVTVTVSEGAFPDLVVEAADIRAVPALPAVGRPARIYVRVRNVGALDAGESDVAIRVADPGGRTVLDTTVAVAAVPSGSVTWLSLPWTPASVGSHAVTVRLDASERLVEASRDNNLATRAIPVLASDELMASIDSDRVVYPAGTPASITVRVSNPGRPIEGVARTTVEEIDGREVALLGERPVLLESGETVEHVLAWNTGTTRAWRYAFRVRVRATGAAAPAATAERVFDIEPGLAVLARVRPQPAIVAEGSPVAFGLSVANQGTNASLDGATARLRVQLEGVTGPARFETVRSLPLVPPGGTWEAVDSWAAAQPPGRYAVQFEVERGGAVVASATALVTVAPATPAIHGTLSVAPGDVLAGQPAEASLLLENRGAGGVSGYPLVVDVVSGPDATVHLSAPAALDLDAGESRALTLPIGTGGIPPGRHVVRLRGGTIPVTLDRSSLVVHGLIVPPSPHAPAKGARVPTAHPSLVVNNASSPEGAALAYEFQVFDDEALTHPLPGATGMAETPSRTSWTVAARLAEDTTYWWRARATDGFSTSAWSAASVFTVDAVNRPPTAPVPDTPVPGARVASRQPALTVRNALDPEQQPLTYEFRLASDPAITDVVAGQSGVAEGLGLTTWDPGRTLDEDAVHYWTARARTAGDAPEDFSPWSEPASFRVHSVNEPPTAPRPLRPMGGQEVATPLSRARGRERHRPRGRSARVSVRDRQPAFARLARAPGLAGAALGRRGDLVDAARRARREHALLLACARERREHGDAVASRQLLRERGQRGAERAAGRRPGGRALGRHAQADPAAP